MNRPISDRARDTDARDAAGHRVRRPVHPGRVFGGDPVSNALGLVGVACYVVIGGLIAWRLPENACGWLLLVGGGLAAAVFSDALATYALREGFVTPASWADWANAVLFFVTPRGSRYLPRVLNGRPSVAALAAGRDRRHRHGGRGNARQCAGALGDVEVENPIVVTSIAPAWRR